MLWNWVFQQQHLVILRLGHQSHDTAFMKDLTHHEGSHKIETTHVHETVPCSFKLQGKETVYTPPSALKAKDLSQPCLEVTVVVLCEYMV